MSGDSIQPPTVQGKGINGNGKRIDTPAGVESIERRSDLPDAAAPRLPPPDAVGRRTDTGRQDNAPYDVSETATDRSAVTSDQSLVLEQGAAASAVRASVSGDGPQSTGYTVHEVPWEASDYHSKRAIGLYVQNQSLPNTASEAIEMLPRVNERI
jgi:hypothetical protein